MKASDVIKVWDVLRKTDTMKDIVPRERGDGLIELKRAIEQVIGIEDDLPSQQPEAPVRWHCGSPIPDDRLAKVEERILKLEGLERRIEAVEGAMTTVGSQLTMWLEFLHHLEGLDHELLKSGGRLERVEEVVRLVSARILKLEGFEHIRHLRETAEASDRPAPQPETPDAKPKMLLDRAERFSGRSGVPQVEVGELLIPLVSDFVAAVERLREWIGLCQEQSELITDIPFRRGAQNAHRGVLLEMDAIFGPKRK